jgi:hypothetical protein
MPRYLDAAGWAAAEAAMSQPERTAVERVQLLTQASECWERGIMSQEQINQDTERAWLHEHSAPYRMALNIAFTPLMKSLVAGNVTDSVLERTFADTLAIAQTATVQREFAYSAGDTDAASDFIGFGHECNALLTLLYMNDPRHIPLPSSTRGGSGYDYPDQTHDLVVINQHWGDILKVVPIEIKAKASKRDLNRYSALIVRGKMHLSVTGKYSPEHTMNAFAAMYEGSTAKDDMAIVEHATSTMHDLLKLYQKGKRVANIGKTASRTRFHDKAEVAKNYIELSANRATGQQKAA